MNFEKEMQKAQPSLDALYVGKTKGQIEQLKAYELRLKAAALATANSGDKSFFINELALVKEDARSKNAFGTILIVGIMSVIIGGVLLMIGIFVTATVGSAIPTGTLTATDNTSLLQARTNISTSFNILGISLIIGGVVVIIVSLSGMMPQQGPPR